MITPRGWWFLVVVVFVLLIGAFAIPYYSVVPALLGITLLTWFVFEWVVFQVRTNTAVSRLSASRQVLQGGREVPMVWAGLAFEVHVVVENNGLVVVPFAVLEDRAAVATERVAGISRLFAVLRPGEPVEINYTLKAPSPGILRFEGVSVRVADLHGFFYRRVFLRDPVEYLILPPLTDDEGRQRATKQFNTLPPPGIHRLRRPGSGSELLELRDYRPGDPPKMIAWKPSARRDRLITKEFENDVPVRAVLFLDTSEGVRLGPPGNTLLTRMAGVAAALAQASAGNRDLVGLTTFDESQAQPMQPARTKIHLINLMRRLAEVSSLQPGVKGVPTDALTHRAYPLAQELYPELMTKKVNTISLGRLWLPLLDRKYGWIALVIIAVNLLLVGLFGEWRINALENAGRMTRWIARDWFWPVKLAVFTFWTSFFMFVLVYLTLAFWFLHSFRGWFGERRKELTRRKQLAALFSLQDGVGPNAIERYIHDDDAYADRVALFLQHHLLRCPVPLYDDTGRYRFRCPGKASILADALLRAIGRARDNELYVILADLAELGSELAPVVRACQVAHTRHHHVLVIVPWPADVPSPDNPNGVTLIVADDEPDPRKPWDLPKRKPRTMRDKAAALAAAAKQSRLMKTVRASLTRQYHESFRALRRELGRAGATVMRVNDGDPVQLVLDRLDRLRGLRTRR